MNCSLLPELMLGLAGVTAMDTKLADVTVSGTCAELIVFSVALMPVLPGAEVLTRPLPSIVATAVLDEIQETCVLRSCTLLSEYIPAAVNCCVKPLAMLAVAGDT